MLPSPSLDISELALAPSDTVESTLAVKPAPPLNPGPPEPPYSILSNRAKWGVVLLISTAGLFSLRADVKVKSLSPGDGKTFPKKGDTVTMHYVGTLLSGAKFDSSRDRGQPFQTRIGVGQVIRGWDEGVPQLSLGEKAILTCSPDFAYGSQAVGGVIPANSTLLFEVELIKIN